MVNISGEYLAISTTPVDGQLHEGEYGMKYKPVYVEQEGRQEGMYFCVFSCMYIAYRQTRTTMVTEHKLKGS